MENLERKFINIVMYWFICLVLVWNMSYKSKVHLNRLAGGSHKNTQKTVWLNKGQTLKKVISKMVRWQQWLHVRFLNKERNNVSVVWSAVYKKRVCSEDSVQEWEHFKMNQLVNLRRYLAIFDVVVQPHMVMFSRLTNKRKTFLFCILKKNYFNI